jgi:Electron transfer DM13
MRRLIFLLLPVMILSCTKKNSIESLPEDLETGAVRKDSGIFVKGPYGSMAMGKAVIYMSGGHYQLALEDFLIGSGPDLKVYLSQASTPQNFYNLGSLKSVSGRQVYTIPAEISFLDYKFVLIHCQQYNHLFAYAPLSNR